MTAGDVPVVYLPNNEPYLGGKSLLAFDLAIHAGACSHWPHDIFLSVVSSAAQSVPFRVLVHELHMHRHVMPPTAWLSV
jgi:hypothetical protein